jgi:dTDP-4-dehydrorhamnose 3,5-epimerase
MPVPIPVARSGSSGGGRRQGLATSHGSGDDEHRGPDGSHAARSGRDERGVVREFFRSSDFADELGLQLVWRQINVTQTTPGAVRGRHGEPMTKLVGIAAGEALSPWVSSGR